MGSGDQGLFFYTTFGVTGHQSSVNRLQKLPVQCQGVKKLAVHCHSNVCSAAGGHSAGCRAACWDPIRKGQINELDRVQKKAAKFSNNITIRIWKIWSSVESWHEHVLSKKRTAEKRLGRLQVTYSYYTI